MLLALQPRANSQLKCFRFGFINFRFALGVTSICAMRQVIEFKSFLNVWKPFLNFYPLFPHFQPFCREYHENFKWWCERWLCRFSRNWWTCRFHFKTCDSQSKLIWISYTHALNGIFKICAVLPEIEVEYKKLVTISLSSVTQTVPKQKSVQTHSII